MYIEEFVQYLRNKKSMSKNTLEAYKRDMLAFCTFLQGAGVEDPLSVTNTQIVSYLLALKNENKSASTINRRLASVRAFYSFLMEIKKVEQNPAINIKSPKVNKKEIEFITIEEVETILSAPDDSLRGVRDRALLELVYATGIRVNEIIMSNIEDVNLRIGFFTCSGESGKARIIPIGKPAKLALEKYIYDARDKILRDNKEEKALFVNYYGSRLTRQGLWKIVKEYGQRAGIEKNITPHILRNSFAVHMIQNGADLKSLQELLGHEDPSATQLYLSVTKNRIKDVYDKTHPRA